MGVVLARARSVASYLPTELASLIHSAGPVHVPPCTSRGAVRSARAGGNIDEPDANDGPHVSHSAPRPIWSWWMSSLSSESCTSTGSVRNGGGAPVLEVPEWMESCDAEVGRRLRPGPASSPDDAVGREAEEGLCGRCKFGALVEREGPADCGRRIPLLLKLAQA